MKKTAIALSVGAAFGILLPLGAANADKLKDITCDQFLAMDESRQDDIVYWVNGIETAVSKAATGAEDIDVGYDVFGKPVAAVVTACEGDKEASLWTKIKEYF